MFGFWCFLIVSITQTWLKHVVNHALANRAILVVEDELLLRKQIAANLQRLEADVTCVENLQSARRMVAELDFDFVLLDVNLPDGLGTDLLKEKIFGSNTSVIVMTANAGIAGAVEAMRLGAADYLVKPFEMGELPLVLGRASRLRQTARIEEHVQQESSEFYFGNALAPIQVQLEKISAADRRVMTKLSPVLIQGETGTGKSTIARRLHRSGPRAAQPLVELNCSALPEQLAESELFGHERGAFTDARTARMGLFEAANGGTLFLDELPSLSPPLQAKVLTAIEDGRIRKLGSTKEILVDVRVIAATNRDLKELVKAGQFREDLAHRLDLFRINLPPLRERGDDILQMAEILMKQLCRRHRLPVKKITEQGKQRLLCYRWPGNVRELAHELERAIVFEDGAELSFEHLQTSGGAAVSLNKADWFNEQFTFPEQGFALEEAINRIIRHALKQSGENVSAAARLLGVSRDYIRYRLSGKKLE